MAQSHREILESHPIGNRLDGFRAAYALKFKDKDGQDVNTDELKTALAELLLTPSILRAARLLPSKKGSENLLHDVKNLSLAVDAGLVGTAQIKPLLDAVLTNKPDERIWDAFYDAMTVPPSPPGALSSFARAPWTSTSASSLPSSPFLQLPTEIRCMIYRLLLRPQRYMRMLQPPQDKFLIPFVKNDLETAILRTCRLVYHEAHYVVYGENTFLAHRIDEGNANAPLIRRAKYRIGLHERDTGEDDARRLAPFLRTRHTALRFLDLEFRFDLLEDPAIFDLVGQALEGHARLMHLNILPDVVYSEAGWRHAWRLWRKVRDQAVLVEWLEKSVVN